MAYTRERLGELLVKAGAIDEDQLSAGLEYQRANGGKLGAILVEQLIVSEDQLARTLAEQKGLEHLSLANFEVDRDAVATIPERVARRHLMIPVAYRDDRLVLAMADPLDVEAIDDMQLRSGKRIEVVVAAESQVLYAIEKYLASQDVFQEVVDQVVEEEVVDEQVTSGADVPIVRLVNQLIREAVADRASDIHIEPGSSDIRVRYRIDGVLHETMRLPRSARAEIVSRIKIMAEMDIAERRRPQDGRIQAVIDGRAVDLRVSSLPTPNGEAIVIRVMNQGLTFLDLEDLGMDDEHLAQVKRLLTKPYGAILVAGPTGSGKSTTLYASLKLLNCEERKLVTIEEPIEYQMEGVIQMAVNKAIGLTFSAGLRQVLRSDPDIVMVGEIRDPDTAETAIRAALTGHLVLSSIHTNDAPSALTRLVDMRVAPFVTSSALSAVIAQRLVRRLCPACRTPIASARKALVAAGFDLKEATKAKAFAPVGCDECFGTGYFGRVGLFEIMEMSDELRSLFLAEAPADKLREVALSQGMRRLNDDAWAKVAAGITSLEEIARVVM